MKQTFPLLILAGSDQRTGPVPRNLDATQMLSGYKGALPLPGGRPLVAELIDRYRRSGRFTDPVLIGPRSVYRDLVDCEIVDVEGSLADTLVRVRDLIAARLAEAVHVAISACDILPTESEIQQLLSSGFDDDTDCCFWWQFIAATPRDLGASSWKPQYTIRTTADGSLLTVYPGHLVLMRPQAVRLDLLIRLLTLAYRYRNLPFNRRVLPLLTRGTGTLLGQDLRNLAAGQWPILAPSIPWHVARAYRQMQSRTLTVSGLERHMAKVLLHRGYRRGARPVVVALSRILSFAQDIDSQGELDEAIQRHALS